MRVYSIMCSNDMVLLFISRRDFAVLTIFVAESMRQLVMTINSQKSSCLRIALRHGANVEMLIIDNQPLSLTH